MRWMTALRTACGAAGAHGGVHGGVRSRGGAAQRRAARLPPPPPRPPALGGGCCARCMQTLRPVHVARRRMRRLARMRARGAPPRPPSPPTSRSSSSGLSSVMYDAARSTSRPCSTSSSISPSTAAALPTLAATASGSRGGCCSGPSGPDAGLPLAPGPAGLPGWARGVRGGARRGVRGAAVGRGTTAPWLLPVPACCAHACSAWHAGARRPCSAARHRPSVGWAGGRGGWRLPCAPRPGWQAGARCMVVMRCRHTRCAACVYCAHTPLRGNLAAVAFARPHVAKCQQTQPCRARGGSSSSSIRLLALLRLQAPWRWWGMVAWRLLRSSSRSTCSASRTWSRRWRWRRPKWVCAVAV